jgi:hypothetical protein
MPAAADQRQQAQRLTLPELHAWIGSHDPAPDVGMQVHGHAAEGASRTGHSADKGSADSSGQSHQGKACLIGIQLSGKLWMGG